MSSNKTRYVILGLLSEEAMSGYEIKKIIDTRLSFFWNESFGQIYPELKRLVEEGTITLVQEAGTSEKRIKKYAITPQGKAKLKDWLREPVEKELIRYEILLKLYFSDMDTAETMLEHVREFKITHHRQRELFDKFEAQLQQDIDLHSNHQQILMVLAFGQRVWDAYAAWCTETIKLLEADVLASGEANHE
jgi:DNA-binding PadR family transcriptional regulator